MSKNIENLEEILPLLLFAFASCYPAALILDYHYDDILYRNIGQKDNSCPEELKSIRQKTADGYRQMRETMRPYWLARKMHQPNPWFCLYMMVKKTEGWSWWRKLAGFVAVERKLLRQEGQHGRKHKDVCLKKQQMNYGSLIKFAFFFTFF